MSDVKDNCPFCGSSKTSVEGFAGATAIECYDCGARGPMSENPSRAALGWWRRAQPEEDASALHMAKSLAIAIWEKHWRETSPHWQPMETLTGLISQIDNMTCTLVQRRAQPEANADAKDAERLNWEIVSKAANEANAKLGAWMPMQWVQAFVEAYDAARQAKESE